MITASALRNPYALSDPALSGLLERAFNAVPHPSSFTYPEVVSELAGYITQPDRFMFIGYEDYTPRTMCYGDLPTMRLFPHPMLHSIYNEGSRACGRLLRKTMLDDLASQGYTTLLAMNGSGYKDEVWLRGILLPGAKSKPLGTVHLLELGDKG